MDLARPGPPGRVHGTSGRDRTTRPRMRRGTTNDRSPGAGPEQPRSSPSRAGASGTSPKARAALLEAVVPLGPAVGVDLLVLLVPVRTRDPGVVLEMAGLKHHTGGDTADWLPVDDLPDRMQDPRPPGRPWRSTTPPCTRRCDRQAREKTHRRCRRTRVLPCRSPYDSQIGHAPWDPKRVRSAWRSTLIFLTLAVVAGTASLAYGLRLRSVGTLCSGTAAARGPDQAAFPIEERERTDGNGNRQTKRTTYLAISFRSESHGIISDERSVAGAHPEYRRGGSVEVAYDPATPTRFLIIGVDDNRYIAALFIGSTRSSPDLSRWASPRSGSAASVNASAPCKTRTPRPPASNLVVPCARPLASSRWCREALLHERGCTQGDEILSVNGTVLHDVHRLPTARRRHRPSGRGTGAAARSTSRSRCEKRAKQAGVRLQSCAVRQAPHLRQQV